MGYSNTPEKVRRFHGTPGGIVVATRPKKDILRGTLRSIFKQAGKRINITLPERVLDAIDRFADANGQSRSGLLARAATEYIGRAGDKALPSAKRGRKKPRTAKP